MHCFLRRDGRPQVERSGTGRRPWRWRRFRGRWSIAERAVGPDGIVVPSLGLDQDFCLSERIEDLSVEKFVSRRAVEGLAVAILPWAAGRNGAPPINVRGCNFLDPDGTLIELNQLLK